MKRTILSLLVVGLFAGVGTSAIARNVPAGNQPAANEQAMASPQTGTTAQKPPTIPAETTAALPESPAATNEKDGAKSGNDGMGNASTSPKYPR